MYDRANPQHGLGHTPGGIPHPAVPLAAPRPGYPAPVASLNVSSLSPSPPGHAPEAQQMTQVPQALRVTRPQLDMGAPRIPPPIYQTAAHRPSVPSTPHPLQPPMTPITPVFARPSKSPAPSDVKFSEAIMRGNSEDHLLPKHGDDFWRRFSMVAKEEEKPSSWLTKNQSGTSRWSCWVWLMGMILLICSGIGIGLWYYVSHTTPYKPPTAVGGSANETAGPSSLAATAGGHASSSSTHVTPTLTVKRRDTMLEPTSSPFALVRMPPEDVQVRASKHSKKHWLRGF